MRDFPSLFSSSLALPSVPMTSSCPILLRFGRRRISVHPLVAKCKQIVNELLEQGVVRLSRSQYAIPPFLFPRAGETFVW